MNISTNVTEATTTATVHSPWDDATWILTSAFIIFTMQSGFGLLESGMATRRNEVNIMMKNAIDVIFGGMLYWAFGYGISFGMLPGSNGFTGWGSFFLDPDEDVMGTEFSKFTFQASFATTATTIVSGAMAERTKLHVYIIFCLTNTLVYAFPAHWVWGDNGWLQVLHVVDVAGVGPVHLVGGVTALIAALILKPRYGRFSEHGQLKSCSPVNSLLGLFILWWGWLGFNCGSTFGISGGKWKLAARAAATTIMASCGGGITAFFISVIFDENRKIHVRTITNGILGSLVSITGICAVTYCWAAIIIGSIGAIIEACGEALLLKLKIDDPVGATPVHFFCSIWGLLCCGLFAREDNVDSMKFAAHSGLFFGGGWYLLGVQSLAVLSIVAWSAVLSYINLKILDLTIGLRVDLEDELLGADVAEHMCYPQGFDLAEARKSIHKKVLSKEANKQEQKKLVTTDICSCLCFFGKSRIVTNNIVEPFESTQGTSREQDRKVVRRKSTGRGVVHASKSTVDICMTKNSGCILENIDDSCEISSVNSNPSTGKTQTANHGSDSSSSKSLSSLFSNDGNRKLCRLM